MQPHVDSWTTKSPTRQSVRLQGEAVKCFDGIQYAHSSRTVSSIYLWRILFAIEDGHLSHFASNLESDIFRFSISHFAIHCRGSGSRSRARLSDPSYPPSRQAQGRLATGRDYSGPHSLDIPHTLSAPAGPEPDVRSALLTRRTTNFNVLPFVTGFPPARKGPNGTD